MDKWAWLFYNADVAPGLGPRNTQNIVSYTYALVPLIPLPTDALGLIW